MRIPVIEGLIKRRLLINFRVDPVVMQKMLPSPFRPKLLFFLYMNTQMGRGLVYGYRRLVV